MGARIRMIGMTMLHRLAVVACLGAPVVAGAEAPVMNVLDTVGPNSAAPAPYGWQLPPDDAGVWTSITIDGATTNFEISQFFENGVALGQRAATFEHGPGGGVIGGNHGPAFRIYLDGLMAVDAKAAQPLEPANLDALRNTRMNALQQVPDLFAPRWGETEPYADVEVCPDADKNHAVYFYASSLDANAPAGAPVKMMITWHEILPAGDCDAEPNSFQMVVTALPGETEPAGRSPVRVEFRYADCGWAVPNQNAATPDMIGARSGFLFDSQALVGDDTKRAIEVLGAREELFGTDNDGRLDEGRDTGASGDASRVDAYCRNSNLAIGAHIDGVFSFELGDHGRLAMDLDFDGVADIGGGPDNCPGVANPYQGDADDDLVGDACDADVDGDDTANELDACIWLPNENHHDLDGDGLGDVCDNDVDGDEIDNGHDNCETIPNRGQMDLDGDGKGTLCDLADQNEDPSDARLLRALAKGTRDVLAHVDQAFTELSTEVIDLILSLPGESKLATTSQTFTFVDVWAQEAKVDPGMILATIDTIGRWSLSEEERSRFGNITAAATTNEQLLRFQLFEDWAMTKMPLSVFLEKYGWSYLKDAD